MILFPLTTPDGPRWVFIKSESLLYAEICWQVTNLYSRYAISICVPWQPWPLHSDDVPHISNIQALQAPEFIEMLSYGKNLMIYLVRKYQPEQNAT